MIINKREARFIADTEFIARYLGHTLGPWTKRRYDQIQATCTHCGGTVNVVVRERTHFGPVTRRQLCQSTRSAA